MSSDNQRLHATVHGRVQGVNYRYFVIQQVRGLEIAGWVRNRYNGTVEVMAEGPRPDMEQLLQALHRGPPSSNVTQVDSQWLEASGEFTGFRVRMTA
ncbi:acylphosphatase [Chloroflexota bacterium]